MTALFVDKIPREDLERIRLFRYVSLDSIMGLVESCSLRTLDKSVSQCFIIFSTFRPYLGTRYQSIH